MVQDLKHVLTKELIDELWLEPIPEELGPGNPILITGCSNLLLAPMQIRSGPQDASDRTDGPCPKGAVIKVDKGERKGVLLSLILQVEN